MAMETEGVRSDVQNSFDRIIRFLKGIYEWFMRVVGRPLMKRLGIEGKNQISKAINNRRDQRKLVDKDGQTKEKIQIDKLSYDEAVMVCNMALNEKVPMYVVADNGEEYISIMQINRLTNTINQLNEAKSNFVADKAAHSEYENAVNEAKANAVTEVKLNEAYNKALQEKINSVKGTADENKEISLSDKEKYLIKQGLINEAIKQVRANNSYTVAIDKLQAEYNKQVEDLEKGFNQSKYDELVRNKVVEKNITTNENINDDLLTDEEKQECYDNACSGIPVKYTVVINKSREAFKQRAESNIVQMRAEKGAAEIDDRIGIDKDTSAIIHQATTDYERVVDDEKYNELLTTALKNNDGKISQKEIEAVCRETAAYGTTEGAFFQQVVADDNNGGYSIFTYSEDAGRDICDKLEDDIEFPNHRWCAYSTEKNKNDKEIHICILDDDYDKYKQEYNYKVDTKHISKQTVKNPTTDKSSTNKATLTKKPNANINETFSIDNWSSSIREGKEAEDYEIKYDKKGQVAFAQIEINSVNDIKNKIAQFQSADTLAKEQSKLIDNQHIKEVQKVFVDTQNYKTIKSELKSLADDKSNKRAEALYNAYISVEQAEGRQPNAQEIELLQKQFLNLEIKKANDMLNNSLDNINHSNQDINNNGAYVNIKDNTDFGDNSPDVDLDIAENLDEK